MEMPRLLGGAPALDFVNTVDPRRGRDVHEYLDTPAALAAWAEHADVATKTHVGDRRALRRAIDVREALYRAFLAAVAGRRPAPADLDRIRDAYVATLQQATLARDGESYRWRVPASAGVDAILHPVLESALELLSSPALARVRECTADDCGWLFLDASRNATRRWCSMDGCGAKMKMRRYRARGRSKSP
jgi:predicted RNA-binding Zn ribbon-like protein